MTESPIRRFCESPQRKLIGAIVTTLFGLLVLIPLVDDYFDNKESHANLTDELDEARKTADALPDLERRVAEITEQLEEIQSRAVSGDTISRYRSMLVDVVRASGCQVRKIDVDAPAMRPWLQDDDPLAQPTAAALKKNNTRFTLERRNVVLLVDGPMQSVRELMELLHQDKTFAYPHRVELHSTSSQAKSVTLELEMWLFALSRHLAT